MKVRNKRDGFLLLEVAMAVGLITLIANGISKHYQNSQRAMCVVRNRKHISEIETELLAFAQKYHKLPGVAQDGRGISGETFERASCGMVPFATLNCPKRYAYDGSGRAIVYIHGGEGNLFIVDESGYQYKDPVAYVLDTHDCKYRSDGGRIYVHAGAYTTWKNFARWVYERDEGKRMCAEASSNSDNRTADVSLAHAQRFPAHMRDNATERASQQ